MQEKNVILLGHGSKSKEAIDDFNFIVEAVKSKLGAKNVLGAHMELASPSLQDAVAQLYGLGERDVAIVPYFLYNGNHIKEDIPQIIDELKVQYPDLSIAFGRPIGKDISMADVIMKQVEEIC